VEDDNGDETANLILKKDAIDVYETLPDKKLDFDDAFDD
jgi:hypothetical protein